MDVALSMEGTVTPRAAGVTVALQDRVPSADPTRAVTLDLANPGTDGKLTGTITYTRNDVTYQGDVSFSPADQIWP